MITQKAYAINKPDLARIDLQSYQYPISHDDWDDLINKRGQLGHMTCEIMLAPIDGFGGAGDPLGYVIHHPIVHEDESVELFIFRVGIAPKYRRAKYGSIMVEHCRGIAQRLGAKNIATMIPEYLPEETPWIVDFLSYNQLTYSRHVKDAYYHFGRLYDGLYYTGKIFYAGSP